MKNGCHQHVGYLNPQSPNSHFDFVKSTDFQENVKSKNRILSSVSSAATARSYSASSWHSQQGNLHYHLHMRFHQMHTSYFKITNLVKKAARQDVSDLSKYWMETNN
jgi:hypothetical protein